MTTTVSVILTFMTHGFDGRVSDGGVFRNCNLSAALENNLLPYGHVIAVDNAFPLKPYLMKPYPGRNLTLIQKFLIIDSRGRV